MTRRPCAREDAVLAAALDTMRAAPTDVVEHLESCDHCRDLHRIASALHDEHAVAPAEAHVPSAGQAWWRAELRARQEATAIAARPITIATGIAAASLIGLLASLTGVLAFWLQDRLVSTSVLEAASNLLAVAGGTPATGLRLAIWICAGALLLATPLLLYVALRDE
jgi:predicted anti-sigma-YlaC factor YlaD